MIVKESKAYKPTKSKRTRQEMTRKQRFQETFGKWNVNEIVVAVWEKE